MILFGVAAANRIHHNPILLGDFNIDRSGSPLRQALTASGPTLSKQFDTVKRSIFITDGEDPRLDKYYEEIAWFTQGWGKNAVFPFSP